MFIITLFVVLFLNNPLINCLTCYNLAPGSNGFTLVKLQIPDSVCPINKCVCISYVLPCSMNDTHCTADEQNSGVWKLVYTFQDGSICQSLQQTYAAIYANFYARCNVTVPTMTPSIPTINYTVPTFTFNMTTPTVGNISTFTVR